MTTFTAEFRSDMTVDLIDYMGDDARITQAARVSTKGAESLDDEASVGLINYLARDRHGSPFEHAIFTFYIEAPIFVWREFMRHRIASYNEESGRYKQLQPVFYIPNDKRPIRQVGKPGHYTFVPGELSEQLAVTRIHMENAVKAYEGYQYLLDLGIAREVARMTLPLSIYSSAYVTMNLRALTNFLSLRTKSPEHAKFPSTPQYEIAMVAKMMEDYFATKFPITYEAWDKAGRIAL